MKNDITYEYRVFTNRLIDVESMEVGKCTSKIINDLKQKDKVDGRFFHTSDSDEWFFCWNGTLQKLNLKGDADVNDALEQVKNLIDDANAAVSSANAAVSSAKDAAKDAKDAADAASAAVENIDNKADQSTVDALSAIVESKQNEITDLETIRSGAALGATSLQSIPSEYITEDELNSKGYATKSYVSEEIGKIDIPNVPTKVSEFENDANYLTEHQDITGKQDVIKDLGDIRSGAARGMTALQEIPDNYVTEDELNERNYLTISNADSRYAPIGSVGSGNTDLTGYATEDWVKNQKYLTEIPSEYVTDSELNEKNYLTEQSLDNYYTKGEVEDKITEINNLIGQATNMTNTILGE